MKSSTSAAGDDEPPAPPGPPDTTSCLSRLQNNKCVLAVVVASIVLVGLGVLAAVAYVIQDDTEGDAGTQGGSGPTNPCDNIPADIDILVDVSGSVNFAPFDKSPNTGFELWKGFVKKFVDRSKIGQKQRKIGLDVFASKNTKAFYLKTYTSVDALKEAIDKVKLPYYVRGEHYPRETNTWRGLQYVKGGTFLVGGRPSVNNIIILLLDGLSDNPTKAEEYAKKVRDSGIIIVVVGVGSVRRFMNYENMDYKQIKPLKPTQAYERFKLHLQKIASTQEYVFSVDDFDQLNDERLLQTLDDTTCRASACYSISEKRILPACSLKALVKVNVAVEEEDKDELMDGLDSIGTKVDPGDIDNVLKDLYKKKIEDQWKTYGRFIWLNVVDLQTAGDKYGCTRQGKPCQHGGNCTSTGRDTYTCSCTPAYEGVNCTVERDAMVPTISSAVASTCGKTLKLICTQGTDIGPPATFMRFYKGTTPLGIGWIELGTGTATATQAFLTIGPLGDTDNGDYFCKGALAANGDKASSASTTKVEVTGCTAITKTTTATSTTITQETQPTTVITTTKSRTTASTTVTPKTEPTTDLIAQINDEIDANDIDGMANTLVKLDIVLYPGCIDTVMEKLRERKKENGSPLDRADIEAIAKACAQKSKDGEEKEEWNWTWLIAVVGGLALAAAACSAMYFVMRRRQKRKEEAEAAAAANTEQGSHGGSGADESATSSSKKTTEMPDDGQAQAQATDAKEAVSGLPGYGGYGTKHSVSGPSGPNSMTSATTKSVSEVSGTKSKIP